MPNYRRNFQKGGTYFFTINLLQRVNNDLLVGDIDWFRASVSHFKRRYSFKIGGFVILPEHLHAIWTLTPDDANYTLRW